MKQGYRGSDDSLIFVIGGSTLTCEGEEFPACSFVQVFNLTTGETLLATSLPIPSPDIKAISVERKIYVITGKNVFVMEEVDEAVEASQGSDTESAEQEAESTEVKAIDGIHFANGASNGFASAGDATSNRVEITHEDDEEESAAGAALNGEKTHVESQKTGLKGAIIQLAVPPPVNGNDPPSPIRSSRQIPSITYKMRWVRLPPIPSLTGASTHMTTVSSLLNNIYVFGGFFHKRVLIFDTVAKKWSGFEGANDQFRGINPAGSACIVAPTKVVNLDKCRTYDNGRVKVIPRMPRSSK